MGTIGDGDNQPAITTALTSPTLLRAGGELGLLGTFNSAELGLLVWRGLKRHGATMTKAT